MLIMKAKFCSQTELPADQARKDWNRDHAPQVMLCSVSLIKSRIHDCELTQKQDVWVVFLQLCWWQKSPFKAGIIPLGTVTVAFVLSLNMQCTQNKHLSATVFKHRFRKLYSKQQQQSLNSSPLDRLTGVSVCLWQGLQSLSSIDYCGTLAYVFCSTAVQ